MGQQRRAQGLPRPVRDFDLERDFGIAPAELRQCFAFYYEAYPFPAKEG